MNDIAKKKYEKWGKNSTCFS